MFFGEEFNQQNIEKLSKKIKNFGEVELCYENNLNNPVLVHKKKLLFDLFTFKKMFNMFQVDFKKN